ncbi:glycosyltransferase family 4 protein [Candidatus Omnitrophota bacterium]
MKILCICYENMGGLIGGVRQVVEINQAFCAHGHQVEASVPKIGIYQKKACFKINYVPTINVKVLRPLVYHFLLPFYVLADALRFKPDVILVHELFFSCAPTIVALLLRRPYFMLVDGDIEDFIVHHYPRPIIAWLNLLRWINFKFTKGVITVSMALQKILVERYGIPQEKMILINNGADPDVFRPMEKATVCRSLGFKPDVFYVGFLGGLFSWHGLESLIKSMPLVLSRHPEVKFIIAGHGPMETGLRRQAEELNLTKSLIFTGAVPFDLAPQYMNIFDICLVFFNPIRKNPGNPIKLFEYLGCGKPVITSKQGGYGEIVERINAGLGVDFQNPQKLAEAIITLIENDQLRKKMGDNGRQAVVQEFNWGATARMLEEYFIQAAAS